MSSPRVSFPTAVLGLHALCGAAWPALVVLWSLAAWTELGDVEVTVWGPVARESGAQYRTITHAIAEALGHEGEAGRRRVDRWLDQLQELALIVARDGRRVVLAPVENVRVPDKIDRNSDKNDRPSVLILPNLASQKEMQDAREASCEDEIEAAIAWCCRHSDVGQMAGSSERWCSDLRACMRDGLTREQVERIVAEHVRASSEARRAGTLARDQAASASKIDPEAIGIPALSRLWCGWSKVVAWRAAALGQLPTREVGRERASGAGETAGVVAMREAMSRPGVKR